MIRVALADDHEIVRSGIKTVLEDDPEIQVIWEASDGQETIDLIQQTTPDVLIVDIRMPILSGLEVVNQLSPALRRLRIHYFFFSFAETSTFFFPQVVISNYSRLRKS